MSRCRSPPRSRPSSRRTSRRACGREPTKDVQAYRLFLQGRRWFTKYTPEACTRAIEFFDRAIARDPAFALACANMAMAYTDLAEIGAVAPDDAYRRAAEAAERARSESIPNWARRM